MINFLVECSYCNDSGVFSVVYLLRQIMQVVFILIPIILIVLVLIDLAKNVIAGKEDDMNKNRSVSIKRIIFAVFIFLIPTIVNLFMRVMYDMIDAGSESSFLECWNNATDVKKVNQCNSDAIANEIAADIEKERISNEKKGLYDEAIKKQNEGRDKGLGKKIEDNNSNDSSNNNNSGGSSNTNLPSTIDNYTVYTGDSRANLMCYHTGLAPLGGGSNNGKEKCIVAPGKAYTWFDDDGMKALRKELESHKNANIVMASWGTNDLSPNIFPSNSDRTYSGTYYSEKYAIDYKKLANDYPNAKFIVVSVTYFDENKSDTKKYRLTNDLADNFNIKMKSHVSGVSNIVYCDINSVLGNNYKYAFFDGIHYYTKEDNQKILDEIRKCI